MSCRTVLPDASPGAEPEFLAELLQELEADLERELERQFAPDRGPAVPARGACLRVAGPGSGPPRATVVARTGARRHSPRAPGRDEWARERSPPGS